MNSNNTSVTLPCSVELYARQQPWPSEGKPGECLGVSCQAFSSVNDSWGYCAFHQAIRAMVNDAKHGNAEVRRVLGLLGVKS